MKRIQLISIALLLASACLAQENATGKYPTRLLTIEPSIGFHASMNMDLMFTNLVQWNPSRRLALVSHSGYSINNLTGRDVESVHTDYNWTFTQRFGAGTTVYARRSSHTFLFMAGVSYTDYQETLANPALQPVTASVGALSPDYGLMYSLKKGSKNRYFTFRTYIPLYPWPIKGSDINYVDANLTAISLEFGVGFRIK